MTEIRSDIAELKKSTAGITKIQQKMVFVDALDALMQKYLATPSSPSVVTHMEGTSKSPHPNLLDQQQFPPLSVSIPIVSNVWSAPLGSTAAIVSATSQLVTSLASSAIMTDSVHCTTTKQDGMSYSQCTMPQNTGHFQIPPINNPPPYTPLHQQFQPHPGIWTAQGIQTQQSLSLPYYNAVTGQFLTGMDPMQHNSHESYTVKVHNAEPHRNEKVQQMGGISYYADAVLKGPRLEIPIFAGDDPIDWLQQCENFFDMSGTPY